MTAVSTYLAKRDRPWRKLHVQPNRPVILLCLNVKVKMLVTQSSLTLCNTMDGSPPDSSAHGVLQARILEWVAVPFSRGSFQPRD